MKLLYYCKFFIFLFYVTSVMYADQDRRKNMGLFRDSDQKLAGIRFGNWGSRPYEYYWASNVVPVANKQVIDLGIGIPSQYNWYEYIANTLRPTFYVGIDYDDRIKQEIKQGLNFDLRHMNMTLLRYADKTFDVAYCISTFEHIHYKDCLKAIAEAHRVLKNDGMLIITLDEEWDSAQPTNYDNGWNILEQSLIQDNLFSRRNRSFGLPEFLTLIQDYFVPIQDDAVIDSQTGIIRSSHDNYIYYDRADRDALILNSGLSINSCVSYVVLKKRP